MTDLPNPTIAVLHDGAIAAVCTMSRVYFRPHIDVLPDDDPVRMHVAAKCLIAGTILHGEAEGPYDDREVTTAAEILVADFERDRAPRRRTATRETGEPHGQ